MNERDWEILDERGDVVGYTTTTVDSLVLARRQATVAAAGRTVRLAYYGDVLPRYV